MSAVSLPRRTARDSSPSPRSASTAAAPSRHSRVARRNRSPSTRGVGRTITCRPCAARAASRGRAAIPAPQPVRTPAAATPTDPSAAAAIVTPPPRPQASSRPTARPRALSWRALGNAALSRLPLEDESGVAASETERRAEADAWSTGSSRAVNQIHAASWIDLLETDGRRQHAVARREEAHDRLQGGGRTHGVAEGALDRIDGHLQGASPEHATEHRRLDAVVERRPRAVRAHEVDVVRTEPGLGQRPPRRELQAAPLGIRGGEMGAITRAGVTQKAPQPRRSAPGHGHKRGALPEEQAG